MNKQLLLTFLTGKLVFSYITTDNGDIIFPVNEDFSFHRLKRFMRKIAEMFGRQDENASSIFQNNFLLLVKAIEIEPLYILLALVVRVMETTPDFVLIIHTILNDAVGFEFITSFHRREILKHLKIQDSSKIL